MTSSAARRRRARSTRSTPAAPSLRPLQEQQERAEGAHPLASRLLVLPLCIRSVARADGEQRCLLEALRSRDLEAETRAVGHAAFLVARAGFFSTSPNQAKPFQIAPVTS